MAKEDENKDRGNWDNKADYLLSCIGYAVGLGNVWRFPYLAYKNGGGAFLIPYVIMLVLAGMPIFFMECALGQFASLGPVAVWKLSPIFKGIGICMTVISAMVGIYYNIIIAYTVFYFFSSLTSTLPWSDCNNFWNNVTTCNTTFATVCNVSFENVSQPAPELIQKYFSAYELVNETYHQVFINEAAGIANESNINITLIGCGEDDLEKLRKSSPSEEYWNNYTLARSSTMEPEHTGEVRMQIVLSLMVAWIVVFYSLIKGVKSSGKVVYFTALFPYVVLLILLIRGATLEGAYDGVQFYIGSKSDFSKLRDASVWKDAATQIFFSLSASWGGLIALSSYNKFNNNCFFDAILVCVVNCATSLFAGFAIFTIVGHMAHKLSKPVDQVVDAGFGLAFVAYPEAINQLPVAPIWAILFFLMLFTLGLDSQFTILETVATALVDAFPQLFRNRRWQITLMLAVVMFLLGLNCCTSTGIYWVNLIDYYTAGWGLLIIAVLELIAVMWVYGGNRFINDIEMMIGKKHWLFWLWWRACWFFISPILLIAVLVWSLVTFEPATYGDYEYPNWANALGWCMIGFALLFIPLMAIVEIVKAKGSIIKAASPAKDWGPYLKRFRGNRYANMDDPVEALAIALEDNKTASNPTFTNDGNEEAGTKM